MQITIDILSLFLGVILGGAIICICIAYMYFDDKWDTAFGTGWKCGSDYQKMENMKQKEQKEVDK